MNMALGKETWHLRVILLLDPRGFHSNRHSERSQASKWLALHNLDATCTHTQQVWALQGNYPVTLTPRNKLTGFLLFHQSSHIRRAKSKEWNTAWHDLWNSKGHTGMIINSNNNLLVLPLDPVYSYSGMDRSQSLNAMRHYMFFTRTMNSTEVKWICKAIWMLPHPQWNLHCSFSAIADPRFIYLQSSDANSRWSSSGSSAVSSNQGSILTLTFQWDLRKLSAVGRLQHDAEPSSRPGYNFNKIMKAWVLLFLPSILSFLRQPNVSMACIIELYVLALPLGVFPTGIHIKPYNLLRFLTTDQGNAKISLFNRFARNERLEKNKISDRRSLGHWGCIYISWLNNTSRIKNLIHVHNPDNTGTR